MFDAVLGPSPSPRIRPPRASKVVRSDAELSPEDLSAAGPKRVRRSVKICGPIQKTRQRAKLMKRTIPCVSGPIFH